MPRAAPALTRRAVVGSLVASAALPARAETIGTNPDVVIIGAGAAGIAAAHRLIELGHSVVIVEAADRIGGRAHTETTTFGVPFDLGCSWVQGPADLLYVRLARDWGMTLVAHGDASEQLFVGSRRATSAERAAYGKAWGRIEAAIEAAGEQGQDVAAASVVPNDLPFAEIVQTWKGPMDFAIDFADLSTMDVSAYVEYGSNFIIKEGYGTVIARYGAVLPVRLRTPATRIDWAGNGVAVETPAGVLRAGACIVTVSTGVLAVDAIRFSPALPDWKREAIDNLPMGLLAKIGLQFDGERFGLIPNQWLSYDVPGPMPARACYFLTFPFGFDIMVGFVGGRFGWELAAAGEAAAVDFALGELVKMLGSAARRHFVKGFLTRWDANPLTRGAYSAARPGHFAARAALARPLDDRVFFAGEAVATPYVALCGGAHLSGVAVADSVAAVLT